MSRRIMWKVKSPLEDLGLGDEKGMRKGGDRHCANYSHCQRGQKPKNSKIHTLIISA